MTREEAIKKINAIKKYLITGNPIWDVKEIDEVLNMAIEALKQEPVKHGEWKCMADCGVTECDQCGWSIEEYVGDYNFCPNCGARMDKGGDTE